VFGSAAAFEHAVQRQAAVNSGKLWGFLRVDFAK